MTDVSTDQIQKLQRSVAEMGDQVGVTVAAWLIRGMCAEILAARILSPTAIDQLKQDWTRMCAPEPTCGATVRLKRKLPPEREQENEGWCIFGMEVKNNHIQYDLRHPAGGSTYASRHEFDVLPK